MKLWLLAARCPRCKSPPPIRATTEIRRELRKVAPDVVLHTVRCGVHCPVVYDIEARAYQQARPAKDSAA